MKFRKSRERQVTSQPYRSKVEGICKIASDRETRYIRSPSPRRLCLFVLQFLELNFFPESRRFPRPLAAGAVITIVYLVLVSQCNIYNTWEREGEGEEKSVGHAVVSARSHRNSKNCDKKEETASRFQGSTVQSHSTTILGVTTVHFRKSIPVYQLICVHDDWNLVKRVSSSRFGGHQVMCGDWGAGSQYKNTNQTLSTVNVPTLF